MLGGSGVMFPQKILIHLDRYFPFIMSHCSKFYLFWAGRHTDVRDRSLFTNRGGRLKIGEVLSQNLDLVGGSYVKDLDVCVCGGGPMSEYGNLGLSYDKIK